MLEWITAENKKKYLIPPEVKIRANGFNQDAEDMKELDITNEIVDEKDIFKENILRSKIKDSETNI